MRRRACRPHHRREAGDRRRGLKIVTLAGGGGLTRSGGRIVRMTIDTLLAYVGIYDSVTEAEADYQLVHDLHSEADLIDAYDAAVIERRDGGKTRIVKKHETP